MTNWCLNTGGQKDRFHFISKIRKNFSVPLCLAAWHMDKYCFLSDYPFCSAPEEASCLEPPWEKPAEQSGLIVLWVAIGSSQVFLVAVTQGWLPTSCISVIHDVNFFYCWGDGLCAVFMEWPGLVVAMWTFVVGINMDAVYAVQV